MTKADFPSENRPASEITREFESLPGNRDDFLELARHQSHEGIVVLICRKTRIAECAALLRLIGRAGEQGLRSNVNFA
jgi:hypothetical protein